MFLHCQSSQRAVADDVSTGMPVSAPVWDSLQLPWWAQGEPLGFSQALGCWEHGGGPLEKVLSLDRA